MNYQKEMAVQTGFVLEKKQIAAHTFHLKIQSEDFAMMQYVPGFTVDIYLGNPSEDDNCEDRKYSFWNYEPVYHTADFAICTFSKGRGVEWIQRIQQGDRIYFKHRRENYWRTRAQSIICFSATLPPYLIYMK